MQVNLIDQGLTLMIFGMGTVFVFLTILVFATTFMSKIVNRFTIQEESSETVVDNHAAASALTAESPNPQIMSAIKQAIAQHRQR